MKKTTKIIVLIILISLLVLSLIFFISHKEKPEERFSLGEDSVVVENPESDKPLNSPSAEDKEEESGTISQADIEKAEIPSEENGEVLEITDIPTAPYTDYQKYNDMSEEEQLEFYNSFSSPDAFYEWYNSAKEEYENTRNEIIIDGNTNLDFGSMP